jgi:hypothetical protein
MTTKRPIRKEEVEYGYYSKVLNKPFDSIEELKKAEATHFAEIKAKEDKVATKKADAAKVEEAFRNMNQARKDYKENILKLVNMYQEDLKKFQANFEADRARVQAALADAENNYSVALKEFTDKYPEGYHLTLKDGDFETTISSKSKTSETVDEPANLLELFDWLFGF